jgi:hypothetical protein
MDVRGLPWGVQWEIARLVSLGHCTWKDITMSGLDILKHNGCSLDSPGSVLNARVAPHVEDFFRWKKRSPEGHRASKEVLSTVRCPSTT